jgi:hypothetical protein
MNSPINQNYPLSSVDSSTNPIVILPTKSRRGRKRITDPVLVGELKRHRRSRANDRERTRMRSLNEALEHLRTLLPLDSLAYYSSTDSSNHGSVVEDKLTKIETLRTASAYIRLLTDLLEDNNPPSTCNSYSYNMSAHQQSSYYSYVPPSCSYYHSYY